MINKKLVYLVTSLLILIPVIVFSLSRVFNKEQKLVLANVAPVTKEIEGTFSEDIDSITKNELTSKEGTYAVVVRNLKTNEYYSYNGDQVFDSASLYKLWVMAVAFQKIKEGSLKKDDILSAPIKNLDSALSTTPTPTILPEGQSSAPSSTPEEIKYISMKAGDAIGRMITISDNYSALLVSSRSGVLNIAKFLKDSEMKSSNYKQPPQTTAEDIALFYDKLYRREIVDSNYSEEMINILKRQTLNDRIPKYLPEDIEVAHKTGELFDSKHDGGIVYGKKVDYIIVVMSETKDSKEAAENIAKFSKSIYEYFENL